MHDNIDFIGKDTFRIILVFRVFVQVLVFRFQPVLWWFCLFFVCMFVCFLFVYWLVLFCFFVLLCFISEFIWSPGVVPICRIFEWYHAAFLFHIIQSGKQERGWVGSPWSQGPYEPPNKLTLRCMSYMKTAVLRVLRCLPPHSHTHTHTHTHIRLATLLPLPLLQNSWCFQKIQQIKLL